MYVYAIIISYIIYIYNTSYDRRKSRSQTSDNMDRWKAAMGRVREEKRRRRSKREEKRKRNRIKKRMSPKTEDPGAQKGRKVAKHCVFSMICGSGESKSRLAKAAGAEPAGQMRDEKLHAVVARSTFPSQNVKSTTCSDHVWKLSCWKSARRCGAKYISKSKVQKTVGRGHFWTFRRSDVVSRGRRKGLCTLSKVSKTWGFCSMSENDGRRGTFEEDLQRCIFRGRRSTRDMFIRAVRRSGRWFPERGCILEHQIFSFGKMILRDRCSTAYDLASLFRGRRSTLDSFRQVEWKNRKTHSYEAISSALNFPFLKEISQNCFVFDVVNFENWGRLAELLRFWCGQFEKWRKSRRIASFLTLSSSKNEEVSQNCCVFDIVKFKEWGSLSQNSFVFKLADRQIDR